MPLKMPHTSFNTLMLKIQKLFSEELTVSKLKMNLKKPLRISNFSSKLNQRTLKPKRR
jgi:hypothetical protein